MPTMRLATNTWPRERSLGVRFAYSEGCWWVTWYNVTTTEQWGRREWHYERPLPEGRGLRDLMREWGVHEATVGPGPT